MSNDNTNVALMDQYADVDATSAGNVVQAPLAHVGLAKKTNRTIADTSFNSSAIASTVNLIEWPVVGLLTCRAGASSEELSQALQKRLSFSLPSRLLSNSEGDCCIRWMSPDEWLLSCPLDEAFAIERDLRALVDGHVAIVNVSGGYSVLELEGVDAINVLKKSTAYDVAADSFSDGKVINTTLAKTQVTLRAIETGSYELVVRRSYADYLWIWLQRAGREYGLQAQAADT